MFILVLTSMNLFLCKRNVLVTRFSYLLGKTDPRKGHKVSSGFSPWTALGFRENYSRNLSHLHKTQVLQRGE